MGGVRSVVRTAWSLPINNLKILLPLNLLKMNNQLDISVLTLVQDRRDHLANLVAGVLKSNVWPKELIVVHMGEPAWDVASAAYSQVGVVGVDYQKPARPDTVGRGSNAQSAGGKFVKGPMTLSLRQVELPGNKGHLPLAKARNRAATLAKGKQMIFLDVDCIIHPDYLEEMSAAISKTDGLVMSDVHYLASGINDSGWTFEKFEASAIPHPRRPYLELGDLNRSDKYYLFWSLSFGCTKKVFARIGGFDARFTGFGGEDTDFALSARQAGVPFYLCGAIAYHQYHATISPPLNHLENIIENANIYKQKWGKWPMENWLRAFQKGGFVDWNDRRLKLRRLPTNNELKSYKSEKLFA
ncbi:glycosyl transferase family A [Lewinellaceae bacterium SD302]|nr:glycosyl transferase family A [Lewinellaceae bacterium SD302]